MLWVFLGIVKKPTWCWCHVRLPGSMPSNRCLKQWGSNYFLDIFDLIMNVHSATTFILSKLPSTTEIHITWYPGWHTVHSRNYAHGSRFVVLCFGSILPMSCYCSKAGGAKIWVNESRQSIKICGHNLNTLQWRHNERDCVLDHQPHNCLLNRLLRCRSKKTSKLHVTGVTVIGELPAQKVSNGENVSTEWRHHVSELSSTNSHYSVPWLTPSTSRGLCTWFVICCFVVVLFYPCHAIAQWWRHQRETFSALLAFRAGNSPVTGEFPTQRPVTRSFDVFFDLRLNKRLIKQIATLVIWDAHYDVIVMQSRRSNPERYG